MGIALMLLGVWGNNNPVGWGWADRQLRVLDRHRPRRDADLRDPLPVEAEVAHGINRFAEAMTIFAVICAGIFPGIHVGRVWFIYFLFPIPNQLDLAELPRARCCGTCSRSAPTHGLAAVLVHGHDPRPRDAA
jgi:hypothetical protein